MPKFVVLMFQEGGCDYTIGCGRNWKFITAKDVDDAMRQVFWDGTEDEDDLTFPVTLGGESNPNEVEIYELGSGVATTSMCHEFDDKMIAKQEAADAAEEAEKQERKEKAEYERLQKKFKGKA